MQVISMIMIHIQHLLNLVQIQNQMQKRLSINMKINKRKINIRNQKQNVEDKFAKRDFVLETQGNQNTNFQLFVVKLNH